MHMTLTRAKGILLAREGGIFMALLVGGVLIRLPLMTFAGYYSDLAVYINWGEIVNQHFGSIYTTITGNGGGFPGGGGFGAQNSGINYPPGTPYLFGFVVFLYDHLLANTLHASLTTLVRTNGIGPFIAKIPLLLADIASTVVLYWQARRRHSATFAVIAAASFAFSPALLYDGAIWGQTDGLVALPLLVALFALVSERYILGGVSLALAILLKPQPIIFVPLVLVYLWRWTSRTNFARFAIAGMATVLLFLIPILVPHFQIFDMLKNMQTASYNNQSSLTSDAFNFWWMLGDYQQTIGGASFFGISGGLAGEILFGGVTLLCANQIWRRREPLTLFLALAVQMFGFFFFVAGQHERYLFLFLPLMLASIILARRDSAHHLMALYALGTALCLLNMVIGVGGGTFSSGQFIPFVTLSSVSSALSSDIDSIGILISLGVCATFTYALNVFVSDRFAPFQQQHEYRAPAQEEVAPLPQ